MQTTEIRIGREAGIENELLGVMPCALLPALYEAEHFVDLRRLPHLAVGVAKDARARILGEKGQDALLTPGAFGDIVFFDQRVLAVERNCMEIEIKGDAPREAESANR